MRVIELANSFFRGGTAAYILSMCLLLEGTIACFQSLAKEDFDFQVLFIHLRVVLMLVIILINGLDNSLFIVVLMTSNLQKRLFICWGLHSLSFLIFFLNILNEEKIFNSMNNWDFIFRCIFYGILVTNSLFFLVFMIFIVLLSVLIMFFPRLRNRLAMFDEINHIFLGDLNNQEAYRDPRYLPLNDQELDDMHSVELGPRNSENHCIICLLEISETDKIIELNVCHHKYHSGCLKLWLRTKPECPMCRINVRQPIPVEP